MSEVEVLSFSLNSPDPLFKVIYTPSGKLPKELAVVGVVLTKVTALDCFTPVTSYRLSPAFVFGNEVVLGEAFWDPQRDGGDITVTPIKGRKKAT